MKEPDYPIDDHYSWNLGYDGVYDDYIDCWPCESFNTFNGGLKCLLINGKKDNYDENDFAQIKVLNYRQVKKGEKVCFSIALRNAKVKGTMDYDTSVCCYSADMACRNRNVYTIDATKYNGVDAQWCECPDNQRYKVSETSLANQCATINCFDGDDSTPLASNPPVGPTAGPCAFVGPDKPVSADPPPVKYSVINNFMFF